jgi:hypothetical protein
MIYITVFLDYILYCLSRGLGEKPSPSGEDFSMHAAGITVQSLNFKQLPHAGFSLNQLEILPVFQTAVKATGFSR